ncbi:MAG: PIN domain-containing protein [Nitrospirales bacterium]
MGYWSIPIFFWNVFLDDPKWATWSEEQLGNYGASHHLYINPMVYAEISIGFSRIEDLEQTLMEGGFIMLPIPKEALFLAEKTFLQYRKRKGTKRSPLPDFHIGAHAAIEDLPLLTRDQGRYRTYFPPVAILGP